jgi:ribosomal-protein-alanine N-acetyltransferase
MLEVNFSPFPVLETERLLLRKPEMSDSAQMFKMRSDATAMKYIGKPVQQNESESVKLLEVFFTELEANRGITWAIALKEEPAILIGTIGFWRMIPEHHRAEIGYMLLPEHFGKGYITEAIKTTLEYGFNNMKLHSVEAHIDPENIGSSSVLVKNGFVKEAHFKENFYDKGEFRDSAIYSRLQ